MGSVFSSDYPSFEVILVDNNSKDGSVEYVSKTFDDVKIVKLDTNRGFAEANNLGIRLSHGDIVVFLNNDTKVEKMWLREIVNALQQEKDIAIAQSKLLNFYTPDTIDSLGGALDIFGNGFDVGKNTRDKEEFAYTKEVFHACFAAAGVKRSVLKKIGLLDPLFFFSVEDVDLCWRARLMGYKVVLVCSSVVWHKVSATARKWPARILFHMRKNRLAMLIINYGFLNLLKILPSILLFYLAGFLIELAKRKNLKLALTFPQAILWNLRNLSYIVMRRRTVQRYIRKVPDKQITRYMVKRYMGFDLYKTHQLEMKNSPENKLTQRAKNS